MSTWLLRGARVVDPSMAVDDCRDVLIRKGRIEELFVPQQCPTPQSSWKVIDLDHNCVIAPGFIDLHVHFRDPGYVDDEDLVTGSAAAVAGGYTSVFCMPNTKPVNDSIETTQYIVNRAKQEGHCHVYPVGAVTVGLQGHTLSPMRELFQAGCMAFSDDGRPVWNTALLREAMMICSDLDVPLIEHCEDLKISEGKPTIHAGEVAKKMGLSGLPKSVETLDVSRTILLAAETEAPVHLAHLSCKESVELLALFKPKLTGLSAEVTPHHLVLTDATVGSCGTDAKMYPPLRTQEDCDALVTALAQGLIDAVATDHAPHGAVAKRQPYALAPNGVLGLQYALSVLLSLVEDGRLTLYRLIESLTHVPARLGRIAAGTLRPGSCADVVVFSLGPCRSLAHAVNPSKSKNTPFVDFVGRGEVLYTFVKGVPVFSKDK